MKLRKRQPFLSLAACIESLERRMLLSLSPAGIEFRANTFTTLSQSIPAIAADADGDFVIAWSGQGSGETGAGVFAQRYNSAGIAQGSEFRVNTFTTGTQQSAAIAMDADGDFVIAWTSNGQDGSGLGVYAQRYNATGATLGGEFRANTTTSSTQGDPSVAMDAGGNFIIAWSGNGAGDTAGVFAQRYDAAGVPQGGEVLVNTFTTGTQGVPSIAMDASGDHVIAWIDTSQDGSGNGIYAQRFSAPGVAQGGEFRVNTFTTGTQTLPAAAMDSSGDFVVAWQSDAQDGSNYGVYAQRYNAAGIAQGGEFRVNTFTTDAQRRIASAMDADGDFLITWQSDDPFGPSLGAFGQSYNAASAAIGAEFRANTFDNGQQRDPAVAMNAKGDAIIAWDSGTQDGSNYGIYAQRYAEANPDTAAPMVGGLFVLGEPVAPGARVSAAVSSVVLSFSEEMSVAGGTTGPNSATNRLNYRLTRNGIDVSSRITFASFGFNVTTGRYQVSLTVSPALQDGTCVVTARNTLRDIAANGLDGDLDGSADGDFSSQFLIDVPVATGPEFRVNTFTTGAQRVANMAMDADGDFVVAWTSDGQDGSGQGVYAQRYNATGLAQGAEFRVNTTTADNQQYPDVAMDAGGNFVVVWESNLQDGAGRGVYAQRYNAAGVAQGGEFRANTFTANSQDAAVVAMDASGDFVIAWDSVGQEAVGQVGVYAQRYNAAGVPQGGEFHVNTFTTKDQETPAVAMDPDGNFVIVWASDDQAAIGSSLDIYGQRYNSAGAPQGSEFPVSTLNNSFQWFPDVAMDVDGDFVVVWETLHFGDGDIAARRYSAAGVALGGEFSVNAASNTASGSDVAIDAAGNFIIVWDGEGSGDNQAVTARRFGSSGLPLGGEFRVNTFTTGFQFRPVVGMDASGEFAVAWEGNTQDPDGSAGMYAQRFAYRPQVTASSFVFESAAHGLNFSFSNNVAASLGTDDLLLENLTTSSTIPAVELSLSYDTATNIASFSYTGNASGIAGVLPDGDYRATLLASGITSAGGAPLAANHVFNFFFLNGDADRDRDVDSDDFNILASNFGSSGRTFAQGNFSYDPAGIVDSDDFNILATRFGVSVAPSAAAFAQALIQPRNRVIDVLRSNDPDSPIENLQ